MEADGSVSPPERLPVTGEAPFDSPGPSGAVRRKTIVVSGPLALRIGRIEVARAGGLGVEVTTLPMVVARLAGGFSRPAAAEDLLPAITAALAEGGLQDLGSISDLPGTPRAVARTLTALWRSGSDPHVVGASPRAADLALIDARVRAALPPGVLLPPDLRDRALSRLRHAPAVLGAVELRGVLDVDLVWRPVVLGLSRHIPLTWITRGVVDRAWFPASVALFPKVAPRIVVADACADPRAEVVEALRWARELLARGDVAASEVAIATTSTESYDAQLPALAREAGLPLFSTHGLPALDSLDGRACAALADALLRGPTQERMRRLLRLVDVDGIPADWSRRLPRGALLADAGQWRSALEAARPQRTSGARAEEALPDLVALLSGGHAVAAEAGERVLRGGARRLWRDALRMAPAAALELSLGGLRTADPSEAGAGISWGPAAHLAAAPRAHVRLLGLTARDWPRSASQDPLLPGGEDDVFALGQADRDLLHFDVIAGAASGGLSVSRPRRSAEGAPSPPSRLWPEEGRSVPRGRVPLHAYGEADRLLARPGDARAESRIAAGLRCWRAWRQPALTPYDGLIQADDPVVARALSRILPVAALERLLRDPLAFVLLDACGLRGVEAEASSLAIDPRARGELVHEVLRRAIEMLAQDSGSGEGGNEIGRAVVRAADEIFTEWPVVRAVPPAVPWRHAVNAAADLAREGLSRVRVAPGTTRWAEVSFGLEGAPDGGGPPGWASSDPVNLGGLRVGGRIDCLDVRADGGARVTDWKTGEPPPDGVGLRGGLELQRVVYSVAAHRVLPAHGAVRALIVHLGDDVAPYRLEGVALEHCRSTLGEGLSIAARRLREGWAMPGVLARDETYDRIRLALPADLRGWLDRKAVALDEASKPLRPLWDHT